MNTDKLLIYEMPAIAEFISNDWLQGIIAKYVANKINRKVKRYNQRVERAEYLKNLTNKSL